MKTRWPARQHVKEMLYEIGARCDRDYPCSGFPIMPVFSLKGFPLIFPGAGRFVRACASVFLDEQAQRLEALLCPRLRQRVSVHFWQAVMAGWR